MSATMAVDLQAALSDHPAHLRVVGAVVGASVPALGAVVAWWLGVGFIAVIAGAGVPIGGALGALMAAPAAGPHWGRAAAGAAIAGPIVASVVLVAVGGGDPAAILPGLAVVVAFAEIIGLPVTVPAALMATLLVRRLARMPDGAAMRATAWLGAAALAAGALTALALVAPVAGGPGR